MNPYINIALIIWTLALSFLLFVRAAKELHEGVHAALFTILSFLSLFTALLGIGQYIN